MKLTSLILILTFIVYPFTSRAQENGLKPIRFNHVTPKEGLSNNNVIFFYQDKNNFLWMGTEIGLNRYDGYNLKTYYFNSLDTNSLSNNIVSCMHEDDKGRLWLGTGEGVDIFIPEIESFIHYSANKLNVNNRYKSINNVSIRDIIEYPKGTLWIATYGKGLSKVNLNTNTIEVYNENPINPKYHITSNRINDLFIDNQHNLWIATEKGGLLQLNLQNNNKKTFLHDKNDPSTISHDIISTVYQDSKGNIWVGTWGGGMNKYLPESESFIRYTPDNPKNYVSSLNVKSIIEDQQKQLWVGTYGNGIDVFDSTHTYNFHYEHVNGDKNSLGSNLIWSIFEDNSGQLYVASWGSGFCTYSPYQNKFYHLSLATENKSGLNNIAVNCMYRYNNLLFIGTSEGGINQFNFQNQQVDYFTTSTNKKIKVNNNQIKDIIIDNNNVLWYGTAKGMISYDIVSKRTNIYTKDFDNIQSSNIPSNQIQRLCDAGDFIWIGTWNRGVFKFNKQTHEFKIYVHSEHVPKSISSNLIFDICVDKLGNAWFATDKGLNKFIDESQTFKRYTYNSKDIFSISENFINCIYPSDKYSDSILWIGTQNSGINKLNIKTERFSQIKQDNPELNSIMSIIEDTIGNVWFTSTKGISKYTPDEGSFINFNESDGIESTYFGNTAIHRDIENNIYFGGNNGLYWLNANKIVYNKYKPTVKITKLYILNKPLEFRNDKSSILNKDIAYSDTIKLSYKNHSFSLEFAALHYVFPQAIKYKYMLEGFDNEWITVGADRRLAAYTNLDPGKYTFKVKASNSDGFWNETPTKLTIYIIPPYWNTTWFKILMVISIISLLLFIYYVRIKAINYQKTALEKLVKKRTLELIETNTELEAKHKEILVQKNTIQEKADKIKEQSREMILQKEEVESQRDEIVKQRDQILKQNTELEKHRSQLQQLVNERTMELIDAKESAEKSDRLKTNFLRNISHEIRTPMNAIVGFSNLLLEKDIEEKDKSEFVKLINYNCNSLLNLINDILEFSSLENKDVPLNISGFELFEFLDQFVKSLSTSSANKNIEIRFDFKLEETKKKIITDKIKLQQILTNITNNALKFTQKGFIEIGCYSDKDDIYIYIKDSGIGISAENKEIIFNSFTKDEAQKTEFKTGLGLGLALSSRLADILGFKITLDSELLKGSTFYIKIPAIQQSKSKGNLQADAKEKLRTLKGKLILIVEDDETNYQYELIALKKTQATIIRCDNGKDAVDLVENGQKFDLILMDIKMPVMDGEEATQLIKKSNSSQIVVALTAYASSQDRRRIMKSGFDAFLSKPILPNELIALINELVQ